MIPRKQSPDGGWGWMVVLGAAVTNMVNQAIFSQFGLIYGKKLAEMNEGIVGASLAVNVSSMFTNFTGIVTGPILKKLSARQTTLLGVTLSALGMMLSSFATNLMHLVLSFGVLSGIGMGLIMSSTFIAVDEYFTKRKSQAVGIAMAGTGVGQMFMPQLIHLLLGEYGYQGTTLILGALCLNGIPGALLFHPVKHHMKTLDEEKRPLIEVELENSAKEKTDTQIRVIKEQDQTFMQRTASWLQIELLRDPIFVHIILGLAVAYTCNTSFNMIIPFFLQDGLNISRANTATAMSLMSGADLISRFTLPTIAKHFRLSCRMTFIITVASLVVFRFVLALQTEVYTIFILAILCGYGRAGIVINQNLAISEYCTVKEKLPGAVGLGMVAKGLGALSLGHFLGWIQEASGSYVICIGTQSIVLVFVVLFTGIEMLIRKIKSSPRTLQVYSRLH